MTVAGWGDGPVSIVHGPAVQLDDQGDGTGCGRQPGRASWNARTSIGRVVTSV